MLSNGGAQPDPQPSASWKLSPIEVQQYTVKIVARAFLDFASEHERLPSLEEPLDLLKLRCFLPDELPFEMAREELAKDGVPPSIGVSGYDIGNQILRQFLDQEKFFVQLSPELQSAAFDALLGRMAYSVPEEEYRFRIEKLEQLEKEADPEYLTQELDRLRDRVGVYLSQFIRSQEIQNRTYEALLLESEPPSAHQAKQIAQQTSSFYDDRLTNPAVSLFERLRAFDEPYKEKTRSLKELIEYHHMFITDVAR